MARATLVSEPRPAPPVVVMPAVSIKIPRALLLGLGIALAAVLIAYAPTVKGLINEWKNNDDYSVGALVPLIVVYLVWSDRRALRQCPVAPCWWGLGLLLLGQAVRFYGMIALFESAERYSLVLTIIGTVLLIAGWAVFWRLRWVLLFLFLMIPLPGKIHNKIAGPLQDLSTSGAVMALELFGVRVEQEGHTMRLNDTTEVGVVEACSGLRMLTAFIVVAGTLAFLVGRPRWQKAALVLSSVPVAIFCNLLRLVVTAAFFMWSNTEMVRHVFHDYAGIAMMPIALLIMVGELWVMAQLEVKEPAEKKAAKA